VTNIKWDSEREKKMVEVWIYRETLGWGAYCGSHIDLNHKGGVVIRRWRVRGGDVAGRGWFDWRRC